MDNTSVSSDSSESRYAPLVPDSDLPVFNIFRTLRLDAHEIRHSTFLGWLLDPTESHGQRDLFLSCFMALITSSSSVTSTVARPSDFCRAQVRREHDNLDLRIVVPECRIVIGVENKLFDKERSEQLTKYGAALARDFPGWEHIKVFLTLNGEAPSRADWKAMSHRDVLSAVSEGMSRLAPNTPPDIRMFIQHYVDLINDVYRRRAAASTKPRAPEVIETIASTIQARKGWVLVSQTQSLIECGPIDLFAVLPPIGSKRGRDARHWLTLRFHDHGARGYVGRYWRPTDVTDVLTRNVVLRSLVEWTDVTGFKYKAGTLDSGLTKAAPALSGDQIQDARTGAVPSPPLLRDIVNRELSAIESRLLQICQCVQSALAK